MHNTTRVFLYPNISLKIQPSGTLIFMKSRSLLILLGFLVVLGVAVAYRFYDITHYPPGLFPDQAANGEDVRLILNGDLRPIYPRGNGREALFFYLQALLVKMNGIQVWPMFAASAIVGTLTVIAVYFATAAYFGRLAGLLAMFFIATSYWHVTISRTGFRAVLIPLFVAAFTAAVGYMVRAVKDGKKISSYVLAVFSGIAFAGGFYSYIAYRSMAGVMVGILILMLLAALHPKIGFPHIKRYGWQLVIACIAALITILPLAIYFVHHPDAFIGRAGQVSIFSKNLQQQYGGGTLLGTLAYSTRETLLSFFVGQGDLNWRHNVAGHPLINPLVGTLFLLGLAWTLKGTWQVAREIVKGQEVHLGFIYPYILLVLLGMLAPVIATAEGMPHGLRSVGLMVPIFMLAGVAAAVSIRYINSKVKMPWNALVLGMVAGLLVLSGLYDGSLYFFIARKDSQAYYEYRGDLTTVSNYINEYRAAYPNDPRPYLSLDKFSVQTVHFLTGDLAHGYDYLDYSDEPLLKYNLLDPASSELTSLKSNEIIIFTQSTMPDANRYAKKYGDVLQLKEKRLNMWGQEIMRVYELKAGSQVPSDKDSNLDA